ncbi:expressed unknown protein [Seminavis robusta]|uniref:Uncharacterized protein n=1 Tax=Seminavis robusta TaxID=568900 RepID=A0A9N8DPD0_9STRA|nr:expressed unknown protein [Seminavis robusta]|eukprot:Sro191_g082210.1 n/a (452) ;mRNA; r:40628-41983
MSPIDFPDLLEKRGDNNKMTEERGRSGGRLIGNLRSRSRSRRSKSAQRRAASQPPKKVHKEDDDDAAKLKKRRSLSRSASRRENKPSDFVELTKKAASPSKRRPTKTTSSGSGNAKTTKSSSSSNKKEWSADIINLVDRDVEDVILSDIILTDKNNKKKNTAGSSKSKSLEKNTKPSSTVKNNSTNTSNNKNEENKKSSLSKTTSSSTAAAAVSKPSSTTAVSNKPRKTNSTGSSNSNNNTMDKYSGSNHGSPKTVNRFPSDTYSDYETSEDESSDDEEDDDESKSVDAKDLLAQVNARMEQQRLMEEVKELRRVVEKKDAEIEQLTGQLRMAISTKCDLVIAHTELERLHEMDLKARDSYAGEMKRSNLQLMEVRAEVEKEFMNELTQLARKVEESDRRRKEDVQEKDNIIGLLEDKIKRMERNALQGSSARPDTDKVRFYKKKLGVYDQ